MGGYVYPYMYQNIRRSRKNDFDDLGFVAPVKRGDLEGYVAVKDFASVPYAQCTRANAFAQIRENNVLRADMTPKEYINILIKQGQVPNKHFYYRQTDTGCEINEINSHKELTKQVIFNKPDFDPEVPIICKYYTPETNRQFREVQYRADGEVKVINSYEDDFDENIAQEQLEKLEELKSRPPRPKPTPLPPSEPLYGSNPFENFPPYMPSKIGN